MLLQDFATLKDSLARMSKQAPGIAKVGEAFKEISAVLSGKKEDYEAVSKCS